MIEEKVLKQRSKRNQECPGLAHRTVSGAPGPYNVQLPTLGFLRARSAIIHQTIRCATGLSGAPAEQRLFGATVDSKSVDSELQCAQKSEQSLETHRTVNSACPVRHRTIWCH
jgi:hypothetical protein